MRVAAGIGQFSPQAADRFADDFEVFLSLLSLNPSMGRERDDLQAGLRSFPVGKYLVETTEIVIWRVLEGWRELPADLGSTPRSSKASG